MLIAYVMACVRDGTLASVMACVRGGLARLPLSIRRGDVISPVERGVLTHLEKSRSFFLILAPAAAKISADRQDRDFVKKTQDKMDTPVAADARCTLEQLATARVPHLGWLALQDHCFTAAETAKRTQKQVCPQISRLSLPCRICATMRPL